MTLGEQLHVTLITATENLRAYVLHYDVSGTGMCRGLAGGHIVLARNPGERLEILLVGPSGFRSRQITRMQGVSARCICSYARKFFGASSSDLGALAGLLLVVYWMGLRI